MSYIGQIPLPQATEERIERTATAGQTSFTGLTYVNGFISVYLNGVKLDNADFTATDGTTVTLGTGAAAGDTVSFVSTTRTSALVALPLKDSAGNSILSESGSTVTLTADEANVGSNALVVDSNGNVGVGTSSPTQAALVTEGATSGDTNAFIACKNNNNIDSYFRIGRYGTGTTSDVVLANNWNRDSGYAADDNTAGVSSVSFIDSGDLTFNTGAAGSSFPSERMRIDSSGALILAGSTAQKASGTTWTNPSDIRLKENISNYSKGISDLIQIQVKQWEYNGKAGTVLGQIGLGVIADEIESVLPNTVDTYSAKLNEEDETETDIKKFDATEITWLLVNTCKEQQALIESQQSQIDTLTARIEALETA